MWQPSATTNEAALDHANTWTGDCLNTGKSFQYVTNYVSQVGTTGEVHHPTLLGLGLRLGLGFRVRV